MLTLWILLATTPSDAPLRIVTGSGIRLRDRATLEAKTVGRLPLGATAACLKRAGKATASGKTGGFCQTKLPDGTQGWFFEPVTAPFDPAMDQRAYRAIATERHRSLGYCAKKRKSDVWGFQTFILERVKKASTPAERTAWRFEELKLLQKQACLYLGGDKRIYRDESQGARLKRDTIWKLVQEAKKSDAKLAEKIAWFAVQHGHDFECEGWWPCYIAWKEKIECRYLNSFPKGQHAPLVLKKIEELIQAAHKSLTQDGFKAADFEASDRENLTKIGQCVARSSSTKRAQTTAALRKLQAELNKP